MNQDEKSGLSIARKRLKAHANEAYGLDLDARYRIETMLDEFLERFQENLEGAAKNLGLEDDAFKVETEAEAQRKADEIVNSLANDTRGEYEPKAFCEAVIVLKELGERVFCQKKLGHKGSHEFKREGFEVDWGGDTPLPVPEESPDDDLELPSPPPKEEMPTAPDPDESGKKGNWLKKLWWWE